MTVFYNFARRIVTMMCFLLAAWISIHVLLVALHLIRYQQNRKVWKTLNQVMATASVKHNPNSLVGLYTALFQKQKSATVHVAHLNIASQLFDTTLHVVDIIPMYGNIRIGILRKSKLKQQFRPCNICESVSGCTRLCHVPDGIQYTRSSQPERGCSRVLRCQVMHMSQFIGRLQCHM